MATESGNVSLCRAVSVEKPTSKALVPELQVFLSPMVGEPLHSLMAIIGASWFSYIANVSAAATSLFLSVMVTLPGSLIGRGWSELHDSVKSISNMQIFSFIATPIGTGDEGGLWLVSS